MALPTAASAAELSASPATFSRVFSAAVGKDTILLAAGDYGTFRGATKSAPVTITPQPGADARMAVVFEGVSNIRLDGLTIAEAEISGATRDITIANSRFHGGAVIRDDKMVGANIVFDRNTHANIDICSRCYAGRVQIAGEDENPGPPSGVTIKNSTFGPGGNADGIQTGGNGVQILDNEFLGLEQGDPQIAHTDAIQLYGSKGTVIRGNYLHDVASGIMAPDGADHEIIEDNVIDPGEYPYAITLWSDNGSTVRHNTLPDGPCAFNLRCGLIYIGSKSGDPGGRGTIVKDNIFGGFSNGAGSAVLAEENHNLIAREARGESDLRGLPIYIGGRSPRRYDGFFLTADSRGKNGASDGRDIGITGRAASEQPLPAAPFRTLSLRLLSRLRAAVSTGKLKFEVNSHVAGPLRLSVVLRPGKLKGGARGMRETIRLPALSRRRLGAGRQIVVVRLPRNVRRALARARTPRLSARVTVGSWSVAASALRFRR